MRVVVFVVAVAVAVVSLSLSPHQRKQVQISLHRSFSGDNHERRRLGCALCTAHTGID